MAGALLEEFKSLVGLLQSYLTLVLQTATLAMTVASGVVAYMLKGEGKPRQRAFGMLLPATLCTGLGIGFLLQISAANDLRERLVDLAKSLGFGLAPHGSILVSSLLGLGTLQLLTGLMLFFVAWQQSRRTPTG